MLIVTWNKLFPMRYSKRHVPLIHGSNKVEAQEDIEALLADKTFLHDLKNYPDMVSYREAKELALAKTEEELAEGSDPEKISATAKMNQRDAIAYIKDNIDAAQLFSVLWYDTRNVVKATARAKLAVIYGREITDEEAAGPKPKETA